MPAATPFTLTLPYVQSARPQDSIEGQMLMRLIALNASDPTIAALLAQYQTLMGKAFGT